MEALQKQRNIVRQNANMSSPSPRKRFFYRHMHVCCAPRRNMSIPLFSNGLMLHIHSRQLAWCAGRTAGAVMVQARSTFWFGPKSSNSWPDVWGTQTWINVQGSLFWTGVLSLTPVRSGRTWRTTSRRPLRMKSNLIPSKSLFLALCSSGMVAQPSGAVLLYFCYTPPPLYQPQQTLKDKK